MILKMAIRVKQVQAGRIDVGRPLGGETSRFEQRRCDAVDWARIESLIEMAASAEQNDKAR